MRTALLRFLDDVRAAGKHAPKAEMAELFESHFPSFIVAADSFGGATLSESARQRGIAALLERKAASIDSSIKPHPQIRRTAWVLAAASLALVCLTAYYVLMQNKPAERIATPSPPPKAMPGDPLPEKPDGGAIVKESRENESPASPNRRPPRQGSSTSAPVIAEDSLGVFGEVKGKPLLFVNGSDVGEPVERGTQLTANARIEIGDFGAAKLSLADGSLVNFQHNTVAEISTRSGSSSKNAFARHIKLKSGSLFAQIASTPDSQPFVVETPFATARVLSTSFGLSVERVGSIPLRTVLQVKEGSVEFFNEAGTETATKMTESVAEANRAPTKPKRIRTLRDFIVYYGSSHSHIRHETEQLNEEGAERRYVYPNGWAGFTVTPKPNGDVRIAQIYTDGPARAYGLMIDDVVRSIDGEPVADAFTVRRAISFSPGRILQFEIERDDRRIIVPVRTIPRGPPLPAMTELDAEVVFMATLPAMDGDLDASHALLGKVVKGFPIAPVHNNLGVIYEARDDMEAAIFHFKEAVRLEPNESIYRFNLAVALQKIGNNARAIEEAEKAVALDPYHRAAIFFLADAYALVDRYQDAIDALAGGAERLPRIPRFWMRMSRIHIWSRNFADAIITAERAVQLDSQNQLTQLCLATALVYGERYEEAIGWFERAIVISPAQANAYGDMAIALEHLGRMGEAESAFEKALERAPRSVRIRHQFGQFLARRKRFDEAESQFRFTLNFDPEMALAHADLGSALLELGRYTEAVFELNRATSLDPHYSHAHGYLGRVYLRTGRYNTAEPLLRKAIELEPEEVSAYIDMGQLYEALEQTPAAIEWYRRALRVQRGSRAAAQALARLGG